MSIKETRVRLSLNTGNTEGNYLPTKNPRRTTELCLGHSEEVNARLMLRIRMGEGWVDLRNIHTFFTKSLV
jgi:hypothetical protein